MAKPNGHRHLEPRVLGLLGLLALAAAPLQADELEEALKKEFKVPTWIHSITLRGNAGYKDNVLLSHTNAQGSAFWLSGAELMLFRLPSHGWQFTFFADASDARYFDSPSVDNEQFALAAAQVSKQVGSNFRSWLGLNYIYQNQVFDASATYYTNQASVGKILGHTLSPRLGLRQSFNPFFVEAEMLATRQWLEEPLYDFWQLGPRLAAGRTWGNTAELALAYQWQRLAYDDRPQVSSTGVLEPGSNLELGSHALELGFTRTWDTDRHWDSATTVGCDLVRDNGSGFYDFNNYRVAQQVRFQNASWQVVARVRAGFAHYLEQPVSPEDSSLRQRTLIVASLRVQYKISKYFTAQAGYTWDRSISNLDYDDYQASAVTAGLEANF